MNGSASIPLYLFAKAPIPGEVKTRIAAKIGHENCAVLARMMLEDSVKKIFECWKGPLILAASPDPSHPSFQSLIDQFQLECIVQNGPDLGARMFNALKQGVKDSGYAAVMGCDVPHIAMSTLNEAHTLLTQHGNVIGPAEDGGFYFLGINHQNPEIFNGVDWGKESVCLKVCDNYRKQNMELLRCQKLRDIDTWSDLQWLIEKDSRYAAVLE